MRVTDSARAASAATWMAASAAGSLGLIVLSYAVTLVLSVGFDGPFRVIEELLWLVPASAMVWGLLQLSNSVEERALPLLTAVAWIVMTMVDLSSLVLSLACRCPRW